ncbi:MAG: hypothetical protein Q7T20_14920 [Saprospiraceae bacterium]|nr:hypothetical protein [Saprospiraceae bacterium]
MEQSQLIELIQTLNPSERAQIKEFAQISFVNHGAHRAKVILLLDLCMAHPWKDPATVPDKRSMHASLYPEHEFKQWRLEHVMVEAHKIVRSFLGMKHYLSAENEFDQVLDFAKIVRARGLKNRYNQLITRLQKLQEETVIKCPEHYRRQFELESEIHFEECLNNHKKGDLNIPNLLKATDTFSFIRQFAVLSRYLLQQKVTRIEVPDYVQHYLDQYPIPTSYLEASPLLKINYEIFNTLKKGLPDLQDIQTLFELVRAYEKNIDDESLQEFYAYLRNFCVIFLMHNPEKLEIRQTLHELYQDNLASGYLLYNGKMSSSRYRAAIDNAIQIGQLEWAHTFIENYKNELLGENESRDLYRFNKAYYLFATGQFVECLDCLPDASTFVDYLFFGKRLELMALYELKSELFHFKLDAFKMFLSRTSQKLLPEPLNKRNLEFANALQQLAKSNPGDLKRAERVYQRIKENKHGVDRQWLLEKARSLGRK